MDRFSPKRPWNADRHAKTRRARTLGREIPETAEQVETMVEDARRILDLSASAWNRKPRTVVEAT